MFKCTYKWYGNNYGGFYVCPEMLQNSGGIVYSAGIGEDISFDKDIMDEFKYCVVFAFDPTPKSINWIKAQNLSENFIFTPCGISGKTEEQKLYLATNMAYDDSASIYVHKNVSEDAAIIVRMKSLDDITVENKHQYIDILKWILKAVNSL
jgi:hypothetical protein